MHLLVKVRPSPRPHVRPWYSPDRRPLWPITCHRHLPPTLAPLALASETVPYRQPFCPIPHHRPLPLSRQFPAPFRPRGRVTPSPRPLTLSWRFPPLFPPAGMLLRLRGRLCIPCHSPCARISCHILTLPPRPLPRSPFARSWRIPSPLLPCRNAAATRRTTYPWTETGTFSQPRGARRSQGSRPASW